MIVKNVKLHYYIIFVFFVNSGLSSAVDVKSNYKTAGMAEAAAQSMHTAAAKVNPTGTSNMLPSSTALASCTSSSGTVRPRVSTYTDRKVCCMCVMYMHTRHRSDATKYIIIGQDTCTYVSVCLSTW